MRIAAFLVAFCVVASTVFAGCLGQESKTDPKAQPKPAAKKPTPTPSPTTPRTQDEINQTLGKRWHFHNYWGLSPTIVLFDGEVALSVIENATVSVVPTRGSVGTATFGLPFGKIVPPETGTITVHLLYNESPALGPVDVSYKPGNSADFLPGGRGGANDNVTINVGPDMTDIPHRGRSVWEFRLSAAPATQGIGVANGTIHVKVLATIGRPIFIDPPHIDHWRGEDMLPILDAERAIKAAKLPLKDTYVAVDDEGTAGQRATLAEFPVVNGSVVPEGTRIVLVRLTWSSDTPDLSPPALEYSEENSGQSGTATPVSDKPQERLYRIDVIPRQTDSPYANQSTWRFRVVINLEAAAFSGAVKLEAWASRLGADAATFPEANAAGNRHDDDAADRESALGPMPVNVAESVGTPVSILGGPPLSQTLLSSG